MTTIINHDLRVVNGRTLYMPPYAGGQEGWGNLTLPDVGVSDTVQQYPIGTKYVEGERTFRYIHVSTEGAVDLLPGWGVATWNTVEERAGASWDVNGVVGDTVVYINAMVHDITLNQFAGGYLLFAEAVGGVSNMVPVVSNTAATVGNPSTIVLGMPLTGAATAEVTGSTLTGSIWGNVGRMSSGFGGFQTAVGVPLVAQPSGNYGWIQTWGPILIVPNGATGDNATERIVGFQNDGAIVMYSTISASCQIAGVIASYTYYNDTGNSSNWIILQLYP